MKEQDSDGGGDPRLDRLYNLLPVFYRQRDVEVGQPLRALLQVISEQVNVVEDDIAQLYENWFIETCQDWVVPYIADLIGYRPVHEAGEPGAVSTAEGALRNRVLVPRREVASTLGYRRRKGTLALLELLARDVAGWRARAVEFYQLLAASQHLNHLRLSRARTLDLREGDALERLEGALDSAAHTLGVRRLNSRYMQGRHAITNAGIFVWRLNAYPVTRAPAFCVDRVRHHYTFSVLGNDAPLFTRPVEEPDPTHVADELNVPAPIRRRALDERTADYYGPKKSLYIWRDGETRPVPLDRVVAADLSRWAYRPQGSQVAVDPRLGRISFSPRSEPKTGVWVSYHYGFPADIGGGEYERSLRAPQRPLVRLPSDHRPSAERHTRAHVYFVSQQRRSDRHFDTISRALRAWRRDRPDDALVQIEDSGAYVEQIEIRLRRNQRLEVRAADGARPVIRLLDWYTNRPDSLGIYGPATPREEEAEETPPVPGEQYEERYDRRVEEQDEERYGERRDRRDVRGYARERDEEPADEEYVDDERPEARRRGRDEEYSGGEPSARGTATERQEEGGARGADETAAGDGARQARAPRVRLDGLLVVGRGVQVGGELSEVSLRHCTLVPGWSIDAECCPESETEPSVELTDTGARLVVERSIVGSIVVNLSEVAADPLEISLADSVLDATRPDLEALSGPGDTFAHATVRAVRTTVIGVVRAHAIALAENCIFDGSVRVARTQTGCVRFCYVPPRSRTPRRYNCQPDLALAPLTGRDEETRAERTRTETRIRPHFDSLRYGTPDYCRLAETCPPEIARGADDESEMGVYHDLFQPQRESNLRARLDEYTPAGVDAGIIFAT